MSSASRGLSIGIQGANACDVLSVSGSASLAGTLSVQLQNGYMPYPGNTFQFLQFGSYLGSFSYLNLPSLNYDSWHVQFYSNNANLYVMYY